MRLALAYAVLVVITICLASASIGLHRLVLVHAIAQPICRASILRRRSVSIGFAGFCNPTHSTADLSNLTNRSRHHEATVCEIRNLPTDTLRSLDCHVKWRIIPGRPLSFRVSMERFESVQGQLQDAERKMTFSNRPSVRNVSISDEREAIGKASGFRSSGRQYSDQK